MKVKATQMGYYDLLRRKEGAVFHIKDESEFSKKWMISLDKRELNDDAVNEHYDATKVDDSLSLSQLHQYCKENALTGYSQLKKQDLINAINNDLLDVEDDAGDDVI